MQKYKAPAEAANQDVHTQAAVRKDSNSIRAGMYQGPIPPPVIMEGYKNLDPSFPERIMSEFEKNSEHIRVMQEKAQDAEIAKDRRGQWMAFILTLLLLGIIGFSLYLGNMTFAGVGGLVFVVWVIKSFNVKITKENAQRKQN